MSNILKGRTLSEILFVLLMLSLFSGVCSLRFASAYTGSTTMSAVAGDYIVTEAGNLSMITPGGARTVIYNYAGLQGGPMGVAIDKSGNYIVTESYMAPEYQYSNLVKVTPGGVKTIVYNGGPYTYYDDVAITGAGNYVVAEISNLYMITPAGVRTVVYHYSSGGPNGVAVDSSGNYIVAEEYSNTLAKITPAGVRTVIYNFAANTYPSSVAIDGSGNYIITEALSDKLSKVTPAGVRTVIYSFAANTNPNGVAIDSSGNYIVAERYANKLTRITPGGARTVIYSFAAGGNPWTVAIVPSTAPTYTATIWTWDVLGWIAEPITMDGVSTGFNTPHDFTGLTGTHTFTVPAVDGYGYPFNSWSTGQTSRTISISTAGIYTARYQPSTPAVTSFSVLPNPFSPNGDGVKDTTTMKAGFNGIMKWNLQIRNSLTTIMRTWTGTGTSLSIIWNGKNSASIKVPDGTYTVRLSGMDPRGVAFTTKTITVTVDTKPPTVTSVSVHPTSFKPSIGQSTRINYTLSESCYVTIKIYNSTGSLKRTLLNNVLQTSGLHSIVWNGRDSSSLTVHAGTYTIKIYVTDKAGNKATPYPIIKTVTIT